MKGHDAARIKSRIARLKGGIATIRIGASSSIEMREKKERLDDALNATKAALEEGIVIGGGITLSKVAQGLVSEDNDLGWFVKAMVQPIQVLLDNSGTAHVFFGNMTRFFTQKQRAQQLSDYSCFIENWAR